jgi:hypothetical protein
MGARHRGGLGFSYRPARLHRLVEFIPWNQFRAHKHLKVRALAGRYDNHIPPRFLAPIDS